MLKEENKEGIKPYIEKPEEVIKKTLKKAFLIVLVFAILVAFAIYFLIKIISVSSNNLQNKQNLIYQAATQSQNSNELQRKWNEILPNIDKIKASLPSSSDLLGYMAELEKIASDTGVNQNVHFQNQAKSSGSLNGSQYSEYNLELKGSLSQVFAYIDALEKAPYFTQVVSFTVTDSKGDGDEVAASMVARVYTYQ